MCRRICRRAVRRAGAALGVLVVFGALSFAAGVSQAADSDPPPTFPPRQEVRSGGVIQESYVYHRQPPARMTSRCIEPAGGWYGYGFPVSTFRWGWFGASHYYPTVWWHDGYYG